MDLQSGEVMSQSQSASLRDILSQLETESTPELERKQAYVKFSR